MWIVRESIVVWRIVIIDVKWRNVLWGIRVIGRVSIEIGF